MHSYISEKHTEKDVLTRPSGMGGYWANLMDVGFLLDSKL